MVITQTSHILKSFDVSEREEILNNFKTTVTVPEVDVAAMKSTLNLPWNRLRDIRRWLKTFRISLAPEGKCRNVVKEWVGTGLRSEEIPATVQKNKKNDNSIGSLVLHLQSSGICYEILDQQPIS